MQLPITITKKRKTFTVEFDLDQWEKMVTALGLYSDRMIEDIEAAEEDYKQGRFREISSFDELDG